MNRRSWIGATLASVAGFFGFNSKVIAQETKSFRFSLKAVTSGGGWSYLWFDSLEELFAAIDKTIERCNEKGGYVTFSQTGQCIPADADETVVTITEHKILCPVSAGGRWEAYDNYKSSGKCRVCGEKVCLASYFFCNEHLPRVNWKERWYD